MKQDIRNSLNSIQRDIYYKGINIFTFLFFWKHRFLLTLGTTNFWYLDIIKTIQQII